jgi:hypothetical protein
MKKSKAMFCLAVILIGDAGTVLGGIGIDTGEPGAPFTERASNLFGYLIGMHPGKWPDKPDKKMRLQQCADIMRSSVDTNWLATVANNLASQPSVFQFTSRLNDGTEAFTLVTNTDLILDFEDFSKRLTSDLDEYANLLTNSKLETATCDWGEFAQIVDPKDKNEWFEFDFDYSSPKYPWNNPVSELKKSRVDRSGEGGMYMSFYVSGKLRSYWMYALDYYEKADFNENGQMQHFFKENGHYQKVDWVMNGQVLHQKWVHDKYAISINLDASCNPQVKLITLKLQ